MKIGLRGGHSPNCKGAMGFLDEQVEMRKIYNELVPMLQAAGHTVVNCNSDANNVNDELADGTNKANAADCDIYVTLHMNASKGTGHGTECWLYDAINAQMNEIADRICANFAAQGFQNRGVKYTQDYHDLSASAMPAMIVETLFCDNRHDADLYNKIGTKGIAALIASAITGKAVATGGSTSKATPKQIPGNPVNNAGIYYQAHCETVGWLDPVHDGQTAGTTNYAKRMEALKILMDKLRKIYPNIEIDVKAHIQKKGWVLYKNITKDTVIGSVGESLRLEALEFIVRGIPAGKKFMYRVHVQGKGWTGWTEAGFATGSVGMGVRIEAIQIMIVDE